MKIDSNTFLLPKKPPFIAFEGINGCGKSTLHRRVSDHLRSQGIELVDTREPGGTPLGKEIRKLLLEWPGAKKCDRAELLLFAADRAEHVETLIKPALAKGCWVLCDRYIYSTITFQGDGRGIQRELLDEVNAIATQGLVPDLVVLLDLDPKVALARMAQRTDNGRDSFEDEEIDFHTRIRHGFLECAEKLPVPFLVLDATKSPEELARETLAVLG
jgi:dTMP kinase